MANGTGRRALGYPWLLAGLASAACTTGGTTGPSEAAPPPPVTSVATWAGSARYVETHVLEGERNYRTTFEGDVIWQKDPNPGTDPPLPAGWVAYRVSSGRLRVTYGGTRFFSGGEACTDEAAMDIDPASPVPAESTPSYLYLRPDETYAGAVYKTAPMTITRRCTNGFVGTFPGDIRMSLRFEGTVTPARRMQGEMLPRSSSAQSESGSWDFAAR